MAELNSAGTATRGWAAGDELVAVVEGGGADDALIRLSSLPLSFITGLIAALADKRDVLASIPWADISGKPGFFSGVYGDLTGIPATFAPSVHVHVIADVTGLQTALDGKVSGPASATDNALARFDATTGELIQNSVNLVSDAGEISFPLVASPATPAAGSIALHASNIAGKLAPAYTSPNGFTTLLQDHLGFGSVASFQPTGGTGVSVLGLVVTAGGTATSAAMADGSRRGRLRRVEYLVTVAATTAIAFWRHSAGSTTGNLTIGGTNAWEGGFHLTMHWGPSAGVATASATHRGFCGLRAAATPTDVDPSTLVNCVFMGWDDTDGNVQMMHNDASGTCTKIDLGASFPRPTADRANTYRLVMSSPPGPTQILSYEVTNLETGAVATGAITTNLPAVGQFMAPQIHFSVGGTSSVAGIAVGDQFFKTRF